MRDSVTYPTRSAPWRVLAALAGLVAGCAVGPDYVRPEIDIPAAYKEAPGWKTAEPRAVDGQAFDVDVGHDQLGLALETFPLRNQGAVLGDQAMAAEHHIGGGFPDAARGVDICGDAAARLVDGACSGEPRSVNMSARSDSSTS